MNDQGDVTVKKVNDRIALWENLSTKENGEDKKETKEQKEKGKKNLNGSTGS